MKPVAVFDLETTGVDVETDHIVTAFFGVLGTSGELVHAFDFMVKPDGYIIPNEATEVHGITTEEALAHGNGLEAVLLQISSQITKHCGLHTPLTGHNLAYDLTLFDREMQRTFPGKAHHSVERLIRGIPILDSLVLDKAADRYRKGKRTLIATAEHYGVELSEDEAHGARADAIASGRIIQAMAARFTKIQGIPFQPAPLQAAQKAWKKEQAESLQEYLRTKADPPIPDAIVDTNWPFIPRAAEEGTNG